MKENPKGKTEKNWVNKLKSLKKKEMFDRRNWLVLHMKQGKHCYWKICIIRKCIYAYILLVNDEIAMYHQQTNWAQQTIEQPKVIQEVFSPEVSKLNHAVMNKKQEDRMQFCPEKKTRKKKMDSSLL